MPRFLAAWTNSKKDRVEEWKKGGRLFCPVDPHVQEEFLLNPSPRDSSSA
jgi:hypothetical protein